MRSLDNFPPVEEADDDAIPLQDDANQQDSANVDRFLGTTFSVWKMYEKSEKLKRHP